MTAVPAAAPRDVPSMLRLGADRTTVALAGAIAVAVMLQAALVFLQPVNWDEFRYLSDIYLHQRGELGSWLQTIHVHLFGWLTQVPGNEVDQIITARCVILVLEIGTLAFIYRCSRTFMDVPPALVAVLAYATCSYVLRHGASFRYDPIAAFLLMGALTLLLEERLSALRIAAAGAAVALAALVTVKSAFYLPTLAVVIWARWTAAGDRPVLARQLVLGGIAALLLFAIIALLHRQSLAAAIPSATQAVVAHGFEKSIAEAGLLPRAGTLVRSMFTDPIQWLLFIAGLGFAAREPRRHGGYAGAAILVALALPLATLFFYRNAFPYYYAFILPPVAVLAGLATARLNRPEAYRLIALVLPGLAIFHAAQALSPARSVQGATVDVVHSLFPRPVAYIDRSSMIASFPKAGFFMSSWGMENYLSAGTPIMAGILQKQAPAFIIANSPALEGALTGAPDPSELQLLAEDKAALRASFIPHWGALWVAGKRLQASPSARPFELFVPGIYTIEAPAPVVLDGQFREPGSVISLAAGTHSIASISGPTPVTIRIGNHLPVPAGTPPEGPIFGDL